MRSFVTPRFLITALAFLTLLAACGSSDPVEQAAESEVTTTTEALVEEEPVEEEPAVEPEIGEDDRTAGEIAEDQLDLMIAQLGLEDFEGISACISERLASEGLEITGQGSPELAALLGCEPSALDRLFVLPEVDLDPEVNACIISGIGDFIASLPLIETDAFFQAERPPTEMVSEISRACGITFEELLLLIA